MNPPVSDIERPGAPDPGFPRLTLGGVDHSARPTWQRRLEAHGLNVSAETTHQVIESIDVRDPNGYFVEFTRKLRPLDEIGAADGALTLQAALQVVDRDRVVMAPTA